MLDLIDRQSTEFAGYTCTQERATQHRISLDDFIKRTADSCKASCRCLAPNEHRFRLVFCDPKLRPPVLDEMMPDINKLANHIAKTYTDVTCPQLNYDDLVAECSMKLAVVITKGKVEQIPNRVEFFKYIKTVFNNHVKSLVSKHRLTAKRGAKKTTDGQETNVNLNDYIKQVEISIDDDERQCQISDPRANWSTSNNFIEDIKDSLTPIELLVLREFDSPSTRTLLYAELDASIGKKIGEERPQIKIKFKHYAAGLGIELDTLKIVLNSIGAKLLPFNMNNLSQAETDCNRSITRLEEAFGIQLPESLEKHIIRRALTLAAIDQFDKVRDNQQIKDDLALVGAKIPEERCGGLACYGVLYQKNNRSCIACGLDTACNAEAANFGLGEVTLSPQLLKSRGIRVPVIADNPNMDVVLANPRDEEIYNFLCENFTRLNGPAGEILFKHKDGGGVIVTVETSPCVAIRINKPTPSMKNSLKKLDNRFLVSENLDAAQVIKLISDYAQEIFEAVTA